MALDDTQTLILPIFGIFSLEIAWFLSIFSFLGINLKKSKMSTLETIFKLSLTAVEQQYLRDKTVDSVCQSKNGHLCYLGSISYVKTQVLACFSTF